MAMETRLWSFLLDMNADDSITPEDVGLWVHWLFFYPGDLFVALCLSLDLKSLLDLIEFSDHYYGGWISGLFSLMFWWVLIHRLKRVKNKN